MKILNKFGQIGETIEGTTKTFERVTTRPRVALQKYPTVFLLLVTAGAVLVLSGFGSLFEKVEFLHNHPEIMIILGIIVLIFTGRLYKKLGA